MWMSNITCPRCGGSEVFYSRHRSFSEKYLLPVAFLRPYRCADCFERYYRSAFNQAREPRDRNDEFQPPASTQIDRVA